MVSSGLQTTTLFYEAIRSRINIARDEVFDDIDKQLRKSGRFVALQGNSGDGKSYFLKHQFVPHYQEQVAGRNTDTEGPWRVVSFSPRVDPIGTLSAALAQPGTLRDKGSIQPFYRQKIEEELRGGNDGLVNVYRDAVAAAGKPFRLLLVVDQLEDLFHLEDELEEQRSERYAGLGEYFNPGDDTLFFNLFLKALKTEIPIYIVFSIGTESLDRLNAFQGWPERISTYRYALPRVSLEEMKTELLGFWPEDNRKEMPKGAHELYGKLLENFKQLSPDSKEPVGRVNIALYLLHKRSSNYLHRPFSVLTDPPAVIRAALAEGETTGDRATPIRRVFTDNENRLKWASWLSAAPPEQRERWDKEVAKFFDRMDKGYKEIGGLAGAPSFLFNARYNELSSDEQVLTCRLFSAITLKDPSPRGVAKSYSVPFTTLTEIGLRRGEEYHEILVSLGEEARSWDPDWHAQWNKRVLSSQANEQTLNKVVRHFSFSGADIPDAVRWINPAGQADPPATELLPGKAIIKLGTSALLQEWPLLREWTEKEYTSANGYRKLVEDAQLHYRSELAPATKYGEPESAGKESGMTALMNATKSTLTNLSNRMFGDKPLTRKEEYQKNRTLLTEGKTELVGEWLLNVLPSTTWGAKYRPEAVLTDEEAKIESPYTESVKNKKAFRLAVDFWQKSRLHYQQLEKDKRALLDRRARFRKKVALVMGVLIVASFAAAIVAFKMSRSAETARNNMRLLDFVDSMAKADIVSANTYRTEEFRQLREDVEKRDDIDSKQKVIDFLAGNGILQFPNNRTGGDYGELASTALLQLDGLIDNYHSGGDGRLSGITTNVLDNAAAAGDLNDSLPRNYQYPYVYQALWENYGTLRTALAGNDRTSTDDRGFVFSTPASIVAVESNPKVTGQYAVADAAGRIRIFQTGDRRFDRVQKIPGSISSMRYSASGRELFVSTFGGDLYHYSPLKTEVFDGTPLGLTETLRWTRLAKAGERRGDARLAIISVHNTALTDHLVLVGDTGVRLVRWRKERGDYVEAQRPISLARSMTSIQVSGSDENGAYFMIGGSDASVLLIFDEDRRRIDTVSRVAHPNLAVSAIAFQPAIASRERAQNISAAPRIAVGTQSGDIWLTDASAFTATGSRQDLLLEKIASKTAVKDTTNYQESAISALAFNLTNKDSTGIEQLIASSLDGTIWLFNLDLVPDEDSAFLSKVKGNNAWDHLRLITTGRSVDNLCLVNSQKLISIENNAIRSWPTNLYALRAQVSKLLAEIEPSSR